MAGITDEELIARAPFVRAAIVDGAIGGGGDGGGLTDEELRAAPVPVSGTVGISGTVPVSGTVSIAATPKLGQSTRTLGWATGQHLAISTTAARSTAITGTEVLVSLSVPGYIKVGDNAVTAAAAAGSLYLPAGPHYLQITSGQFVSVLGTAAGVASVIPIA